LKIAIKSCFTTLIQNAATPYPVEFAFSKDWDGFAKTALFEAGGVSMAVVLSEDKCDIPGECLKKGGIPLKIAVYGVKGEERKSTGWHVTSKILFPANISVGKGGSGDPMGDEAYKQIMGIIGDPSTAGFGNKTLTEVIVEIQRSISGTASDKEVDDMLEDLQHIGISVTLPAANWSGGAQTVAHASLLADSNYIYLVGADAGTRNVYDSYGVSADNVTTSGQMTFRCDTTPTVDLSVFIIRLEVGTDE